MNVYLTGTPEVSIQIIENVLYELNTIKGVINFSTLKTMSEKQFNRVRKNLEFDEDGRIPFQNFFTICESTRQIENLDDTDIIVLLTSIPNTKRWFSAAKGYNIFIDINDWDKYTGKDPKFRVAYQVVENIFQLLIGVDCDNAIDSPFVHLDSIGCINDYCKRKKDIILKLRTADICEDCLNRAKKVKISKNVLIQITETIEQIRNNIRAVIELKMVEPVVVKVDKDFNIRIGEKEIDPPDLPKTLFIFLLNELDGVELNNLPNHLDRLIKIYHKLKPTGYEDSVIKMTKPYNEEKMTFSKYKRDLNKYLIRKLGDKLADYYTINRNKDLVFKIRIPSNYRKISNKY